MIDKSEQIQCGWCGKSNTAENWNNNSKKECKSREMRRAYRDIFNEKVFVKGKKPAWYKCPHCSLWSKGSQLKIVNPTNPEHRRLGGEPIVRSVQRQESPL